MCFDFPRYSRPIMKASHSMYPQYKVTSSSMLGTTHKCCKNILNYIATMYLDFIFGRTTNYNLLHQGTILPSSQKIEQCICKTTPPGATALLVASAFSAALLLAFIPFSPLIKSTTFLLTTSPPPKSHVQPAPKSSSPHLTSLPPTSHSTVAPLSYPNLILAPQPPNSLIQSSIHNGS
ncbi:hypothetical protein AMTRI_Chr12g240850 [Amborella trichopoda]